MEGSFQLKQGFSLWSLLAEPCGSNQNLAGRTGVFQVLPELRYCAAARQAGGQGHRPDRAPLKSFLLILFNTCTNMSVFNAPSVCGDTGSLNEIIQCIGLRNLLLDCSSNLLM